MSENEKTVAIVRGARSEREVAAYLPGNYRVVASAHVDERLQVIIIGEDEAGWTFADYVQPRLASGLMTATLVPGAAS